MDLFTAQIVIDNPIQDLTVLMLLNTMKSSSSWTLPAMGRYVGCRLWEPHVIDVQRIFPHTILQARCQRMGVPHGGRCPSAGWLAGAP